MEFIFLNLPKTQKKINLQMGVKDSLIEHNKSVEYLVVHLHQNCTSQDKYTSQNGIWHHNYSHPNLSA